MVPQCDLASISPIMEDEASFHSVGSLPLCLCEIDACSHPGWPQTSHGAEDELELVILLPIHPESWDCVHLPHTWTSWVLEIEPTASWMLGRHSADVVMSPALIQTLLPTFY